MVGCIGPVGDGEAVNYYLYIYYYYIILYFNIYKNKPMALH